MTRAACIIECMEDAREKGFAAAVRGEPAKQAPQAENYKQHGADYCSANRYHESWMAGWNFGRSKLLLK